MPAASAAYSAPVATSDLPEPVGVAKHHVRAADQLDQRLLLRRVQHGAAGFGPCGERGEQLVGVGAQRVKGGQVARIVEQGRDRAGRWEGTSGGHGLDWWEGHDEVQRA